MRAIAIAIAFAVLGLASDVQAQQVQLQVDRGPYYVGTPVALQIVAEGFDLQPPPASEVEQPPAGTLTFLGMSPSETTSYVIVNGQAQSSSSLKLVYSYQFVATQPGRVELGPFFVQQAGTRRSTSTYAIDVRDVPVSDRLRVRLDPGVQTTYVGAQLHSVLEYRVERELQRNLVRSTLQVPGIEQREAFQIEPDPIAASGQVIEIPTSTGPLQLRAQLREERIDGRDWIVVSMPYLVVPLRAGSYDLGAASFTVDEGVSFTRDLFGGRRALEVRKLRAVDRPRTLLVKSVPTLGRPSSFAGVVGRGFSLEVSADRSVVRVGDPIGLKLVLRGDGALASAGLPKLDAEGLLPAKDFAVASDPPSGELRDGAKTFSAVIRVKRAEVREIPELAYSFFDPVTERFETVRSRPIALSVGAAEIVGPGQVVRSDAPTTGPTTAPTPRDPEGSAALEGADLSVVREPEALLGTPGRLFGTWLAWLFYVTGGGLVAGAWLDRRRRNVDPEISARRHARRELVGRARSAGARDDRDALRELAQCVRGLRALRPEHPAPGLDAFLLACDAQLFAPPGASTGETVELRRAGVSLAEALAAEDA